MSYLDIIHPVSLGQHLTWAVSYLGSVLTGHSVPRQHLTCECHTWALSDLGDVLTEQHLIWALFYLGSILLGQYFTRVVSYLGNIQLGQRLTWAVSHLGISLWQWLTWAMFYLASVSLGQHLIWTVSYLGYISPLQHFIHLVCCVCVAYSIAKFGMSLCVLGMSEELRPDGIAVNALWPKTGNCQW